MTAILVFFGMLFLAFKSLVFVVAMAELLILPIIAKIVKILVGSKKNTSRIIPVVCLICICIGFVISGFMVFQQGYKTTYNGSYYTSDDNAYFRQGDDWFLYNDGEWIPADEPYYYDEYYDYKTDGIENFRNSPYYDYDKGSESKWDWEAFTDNSDWDSDSHSHSSYDWGGSRDFGGSWDSGRTDWNSDW